MSHRKGHHLPLAFLLSQGWIVGRCPPPPPLAAGQRTQPHDLTQGCRCATQDTPLRQGGLWGCQCRWLEDLPPNTWLCREHSRYSFSLQQQPVQMPCRSAPNTPMARAVQPAPACGSHRETVLHVTGPASRRLPAWYPTGFQPHDAAQLPIPGTITHANPPHFHSTAPATAVWGIRHACTRTHARTHALTHKHTHTHTHTHAHTTHTHTEIRVLCCTRTRARRWIHVISRSRRGIFTLVCWCLLDQGMMAGPPGQFGRPAMNPYAPQNAVNYAGGFYPGAPTQGFAPQGFQPQQQLAPPQQGQGQPAPAPQQQPPPQ